MTAKELREAMSPIARITKSKRHTPELRRGQLIEITEDCDDLWAIDPANHEHWFSMCMVWCEPANPAAVYLWQSMGWGVTP